MLHLKAEGAWAGGCALQAAHGYGASSQLVGSWVREFPSLVDTSKGRLTEACLEAVTEPVRCWLLYLTALC